MKRVLIVDDIPEYVETMAIYLEERFSIIKASSLEAAKTLVEKHPVDIAILDIRLDENDPENRDGLELMKWIRKAYPNVAVIVMSAYREFDRAVEALNAGADYFIRKPVAPDELDEIVEKLSSTSYTI